VRVGLFLAYWPWFSPEEQVALAVQADRDGLDSVWVSEAWGQDAVSVLGHLSARTERVGLGSGLLQIPARTPAMAAMTAATLDTLSGGRFRLGLGVSGPQVSEGWHGVSFARPLKRTREYVEIVRAALAREEPLEYDGAEFSLPVAGTGLGKPLKLLIRPPRPDVPIYLGAITPKAVEQAGRIADGWLPFMFDEELVESVRAGGREIDVSPVVQLCVHEDVAEARNLARPWLTMYIGGMGARGKNFYVDAAEYRGHGESAREVQRLFMEGDRAGAAMALSDGLIDSSAVCTTPAGIDEALARYERMGADTFLAMPFGDRPRIVEALAAAIARAPTT
jgi:F420-dependent oxidoreductase-like protein